MNNIGSGHLAFALVFVIVFVAGIVYAYRRDVKKVGNHYKRVWLVILGILVIYFTIFFLNRIT